MAEHLDFYKCEICGTIIQVFNRGDGELVCCGKPMTYIQPHTIENEMKEKHIPVFVSENKIQVGSVLHPMTEEHHIKFIETVSKDNKRIEVQFLSHNELPEMQITKNPNEITPFEYCNIHGLWKG